MNQFEFSDLDRPSLSIPMSYAAIEITEVGPPEYPLIQVLRDSIFAPYNHRLSSTFIEQAEGKPDLLALIAHLEGNPVAYKVGFRESPGVFYSWTGGVLPDYRGEGIARRLQEYQHGILRSRSYRAVRFDTFNKFREMLLFSLRTGFAPMSLELRPENEISIKFRKDLTQPDPARPPRFAPAAVHVESVSPNFHGLIADLCTRSHRPANEGQIDREMAQANGLALVAYLDNLPVGFAIGRSRSAGESAFSEPTFDIRLLGVDPAHQRRGVGTALLLRQRDFAHATGHSSIRMMIPNDHAPALRLLIRNAFHITGMAHRNEPRGPFEVELQSTRDEEL